MGLGTSLWYWLSARVWFDWLCLFLIVNPYFVLYYGYDSIGSIMEATGMVSIVENSERMRLESRY